MPRKAEAEMPTFEADKEYDVVLKRVTQYGTDYLPASREIRVNGDVAGQLGEAILEAREANSANLYTTPVDMPGEATE